MKAMRTHTLDTAALDRIARKYADRSDTNEVRFALTSEAGLNDSFAFPFV